MYKRILIATDGSQHSKTAVKEAIRLAKGCRCPLTVLSVVNVNEEFQAFAPGLEEKMDVWARKLVEAVKARATKAGVKAEAIVRTGEPHEIIVNLAKKKRADLVVMGSHGRTGLKRLLMGSVTSRVIGHTAASVLVVKS